SAGAGSDLTFVNMTVMKDGVEIGMRLLSDMARHPTLDQAELDRQRNQTLSSLQVSLQDPEWVANSVFDRLVYGFHPYGMPETGTPETLRAITRDDLAAFHDKYFVPNNAILAIVGDVSAADAFSTAKKVFGDWEKKEVAADKFIAPPEPTRRLLVVDKPDAVQTEVRVGHIGVPRTSPDYMALNLAIRILGGEGSNRLHQVLRTQRALTYGAQASFDTLKESGDEHAIRSHRRGAPAHRRRVLAAAARARQRDRADRREGLSDRQLPADDRNAELDRHAGDERAVLRPAGPGAADVPRPRQRGDRRRHPAGRAEVLAARSAVDRAGRQRVGVRVAASGHRLRAI